MSGKEKKDKDKKDKKSGEKDKKECEPPCDPRNYARYYDSPDGCDMGKKMQVAGRYGIVAGLIAGTYDVLMYSHVVGVGPMLRRYARHVVPLGLMGATFAAASTLALRIRVADDPLNYFLGGLACGPLVALYLRSGHGVVAGGIALGLIGVVKKEAIDRNYEILHKFPGHMNTITGWKRNSSFVKDPRDSMVHTCEDEDDKKEKKKKQKAKEKDGKTQHQQYCED